MLKIHRDIVAPDIGCHRDYGRMIELPDQMTRGDAIKIRHNNIHQDHVILRTGIHLVNCFQSIELGVSAPLGLLDHRRTYGTIDRTLE